MTKTITSNAPAATVRFTVKLLATAASNMLNGCNAIDAANNANTTPTAIWAKLAAAGVTSNSITVEAVAAGLCSFYPDTKGVPSNLPAAARSRWFAFSKVAKNNGLDRLIAGEALHEVARSFKATQIQKGKGGKGKGGKDIADKAQLVTFNDAASALIYWCDTAAANTSAANELANNPKIALIMAALGKLQIAAAVGATKAKAATAKAAADKKAAIKAARDLAASKAKPKNVAVKAPKSHPRGKARISVKLLEAA